MLNVSIYHTRLSNNEQKRILFIITLTPLCGNYFLSMKFLLCRNGLGENIIITSSNKKIKTNKKK